MQDAAGDAGVSFRERVALVIKAWNCGSKVTLAALKLQYHTDEDGGKTLEESPIIGGIDHGEDPTDKVILADEEEDEGEEDPTPEEIETAKKALRKGKGKLTKDGDQVWVNDGPGKEPWLGTLIATRKGPGGTMIAKVRWQDKNKAYDCPFDSLSLDKPDTDDE